MAISAKDVKELRELSGAGMLDCKKALEETDGNVDEAVDVLRKKGLGKAAKKMDRLASEGLVGLKISDDNAVGVVCEINSETDFVAKNDGFISMVNEIAGHIFVNDFADVAVLNASNIDSTVFSEYLANKTALIGENLVMRRFTKNVAGSNELVNGYLHVNGRIGVLLKASYEGSDKTKALELLKSISMHAAAMAPKYLTADETTQEALDKETEIAKEELRASGKPENIWDKILVGKMEKFKQENSLLGQAYVMDNKSTIEQVLANASKEMGNIKILQYTRYELGEGLEKKVDNFADEVAQQLS